MSIDQTGFRHPLPLRIQHGFPVLVHHLSGHEGFNIAPQLIVILFPILCQTSITMTKFVGLIVEVVLNQ